MLLTVIFLVILLVACIQSSEEMHQESWPLLFSPFGLMSGNGTLLQFVWLCTVANR